jgi:probable F420-dependent oxidoreductase
VLTAAAVVTTKVRLGTSVLVAPLHGPVQLAKHLATIDQISGGRLIAGLGAGWSTDELRATGVTRADRGRLLDETFDVFEAVWGPDPVSVRVSRAVVENASVLPKPVSRIPVLIGGESRRTLERVAKRSDGWLPLYTRAGTAGIEAARATWRRIRELAAEYGRDPDRLERIAVGNITFTDRPAGGDRNAFVGTLDQIIEDIASVAASGADELILDLNLQDWFTGTRQMLDTALELHQRATAATV